MWATTSLFHDRAEAGRRLAGRLEHLRGSDVVVLGLPRGGVPVAFEVAQALNAPLDVLVVRKLGVPIQPELAMGALGEDGVRVLNPRVLSMAGIGATAFAEVEEREQQEITRRVAAYRGNRPRRSLQGKTAVIVDDGIATGSTARAACQVARGLGAARVVLAVPVAPPEAVASLDADADEVVAVETPTAFWGIGQFYDDFTQTPDAEVADLLSRASADAADPPPPREDEVDIPVGPLRLPGRLTVPEAARGLVVFVHGSGSSRHSPRNRFVAGELVGAGLGTLLFDLLTPEEEYDRANVFNIELLADRLIATTRWLRAEPGVPDLPLGYFGASTGAAAAIWAAAEPTSDVAAVVSRGGRPDLAADQLPAVRAPTLLIVGGRDDVVLDLNKRAQALLRCENHLAVVPGATHLFEEPGALQVVAELATDWFGRHLSWT